MGWLTPEDAESLAKYAGDCDPSTIVYGMPLHEAVKGQEEHAYIDAVTLAGYVSDLSGISMAARALILDVRRNAIDRVRRGVEGDALSWLSEAKQLRELGMLLRDEAQGWDEITAAIHAAPREITPEVRLRILGMLHGLDEPE